MKTKGAPEELWKEGVLTDSAKHSSGKRSTPDHRYRSSHAAQHRTGDLGSSYRVASCHECGTQPCGFSDDLENGLSDT